MMKAKKKKATKTKKKTTRRKTTKPSTPDAPVGPPPGHQQQSIVVEQWRRQARDVPWQRSFVTDTPAPLKAAEIERTYKEVVRWIASVETVIAEIRKAQTPGIGHNQPPDEIDEIEHELVVLKDKPTIADASRSATKLHAIAAYIGKQADNFTTSAVKSAGETVGKAVTKTIIYSPIWLPLIEPLRALIKAVADYIAASGGTFPI